MAVAVAPPAGPGPASWARGATFTGLLLVAISLPFVIGIWQVVASEGRSFYVWGDQAFIDMSVREATGLRQLTGPYSRVGWSHPGPLYYYALAPFYPLLDSALRLHLGTLVLNWLAASAIVLLPARYAGRRTATCLTFTALVLLWCLGPFFIRDPWNPAVVLLPLLAAVVAVAVRPTVLSTCIAVVFGSLVVQAHVGSLSPVVALVVVGGGAAVATAVRWRVRPELRPPLPPLRSAAVVAAVLVLCWTPPLIEQIRHGRDGNLGRVVQYFLRSEGAQRSLGAGADVVAGASWLPSVPFLTPPPEPPVPGALIVAVACVAGLLGAWRAWNRRDRVALVLCGYAAVGFPLTALSVTRITGEVYVYLLWWMPINVVVLLAGLLVLLFGDRATLHGSLRGGGIMEVGLAAVATVVVLSAFDAEPMSTFSREQTAQAWAVVSPRVGARDAVYLDIRDEVSVPHGAGLAVLLDERGIRYEVDEQFEHLFATAEELDGESTITVTLSSSPVGVPEGVDATVVPGPLPLIVGVAEP